MSAQGFIQDRLELYRRVVLRTLLAFVPDREPRQYLYDLVPEYPRRCGSGLGAALAISTCRAFGGRVENVLRSVVALDLFRHAFQIHNDIALDSEHQQGAQGAPSLHLRHGTSVAVNVGDALNVLLIRPLMENLEALGPNLTWKVLSEFEHMVRQSVEGQAMELGWERDGVFDITEDDYLRLCLKKFCWHMAIQPCRIGALIGSRGMVRPDRFNTFGFYFGAALHTLGELHRLIVVDEQGELIGGSLRDARRTPMLLHLLQTCAPAERRELDDFLRQPRERRSPAMVQRIFGWMDRLGSLEHAAAAASQLAAAAYREFDAAFDGTDPKEKSMVRQILRAALTNGIDGT